jgi:hypothetical protein
VTYTAGVRNVTFRDIFLAKPRTAFSIHFDNDKYSRSYYPGAPIPKQEGIVFDNIRILHKQKVPLLAVGTPVDSVSFVNSFIRNNTISFHGDKDIADFGRTHLSITNCIFAEPGALELLSSNIPNKTINLKTTANTELSDDFSATVSPGASNIVIDSDLTGLRK